MPNTYASLSDKLTGRNAVSRKLANNTYAVRIDAETIAVRLHATDIATFHANGRIVFTSGGWRTSTTKERLNSCTPAIVLQSKGVWTIRIDGVSAVFADGIVWDGQAKRFIGEGEDPAATLKLVKRVRRFADDYMAAFESGEIDKPSSGDCWGCMMKSTDGKTVLGGAAHIVSHMDEAYYVPSLLARAIERFPVSQVAMALIRDKWAGTGNLASSPHYVKLASGQLRKSLYRYCKAELGIAA